MVGQLSRVADKFDEPIGSASERSKGGMTYVKNRKRRQEIPDRIQDECYNEYVRTQLELFRNSRKVSGYKAGARA